MGKCNCKAFPVICADTYDLEKKIEQPKSENKASLCSSPKSRNARILRAPMKQSQITSDTSHNHSTQNQTVIQEANLYPSFKEFQSKYVQTKNEIIEKKATFCKKKNDLLVVIFGANDTGKTTFLHKITQKKTQSQQNSPRKNQNRSQRDEIVSLKTSYKSQNCKIIFYVCKKDAKLSALQTDCYFIFFSLSSCASFFEAAKVVKQTLKDYSGSIYLIGNKCDLEEHREISSEKIDRFCRDNKCNYFEISSKAGTGIKELLKGVLKTFSYIFYRNHMNI